MRFSPSAAPAPGTHPGRRARAALVAVVSSLVPVAAMSQPPGASAGDSAAPAIVETLPDGTRRVAGAVVAPGDSAMRPVAGAWVTLHRVGSDRAGPVDSLRTDARGGYAFRYRPTGVDDAIYFVASTYGGIAYFTRPLRAAVVEGEDAEIVVYDTTSAPVDVRVRGRHAIVSAPESDGARTVLEVFELSNDTSVTALTAPGSARGTWSVALPAGARDVQVRAGEIPVDGVATTGGRVTLFAPFAPGLRQLAFSYRVASDAFPLALQVERATSVLEVLIEDPRGEARGARLTAVTPVTLEGRNFRRFLAQDVAPGASVDIEVQAVAVSFSRYLLPIVLVGVGGLMLAALVVALRRGRTAAPAGAPIAPPAVASRPALASGDDATERLAREIAALDDAQARADDEARARGEGPPDELRERYERRRAELKRELTDALARAGAQR